MQLPGVHKTLTLFLQSTLIVGVILFCIQGRWLTAAVTLAIIVVTLLPFILKQKFDVHIPAEFEVLTVLFVYASLFLGEVQMRHLAGGMNAGIGAPGADRCHGLAAELVDRLFDRLLHGEPILLALPADKAAAVIFEGELVAVHMTKLSPARMPKPRKHSSAAIAARPGRCTRRSTGDS